MTLQQKFLYTIFCAKLDEYGFKDKKIIFIFDYTQNKTMLVNAAGKTLKELNEIEKNFSKILQNKAKKLCDKLLKVYFIIDRENKSFKIKLDVIIKNENKQLDYE